MRSPTCCPVCPIGEAVFPKQSSIHLLLCVYVCVLCWAIHHPVASGRSNPESLLLLPTSSHWVWGCVHVFVLSVFIWILDGCENILLCSSCVKGHTACVLIWVVGCCVHTCPLVVNINQLFLLKLLEFVASKRADRQTGRQTGQWSVWEDYQWTADSVIVQWTLGRFCWTHTPVFSCQFSSQRSASVHVCTYTVHTNTDTLCILRPEHKDCSPFLNL